MKNLRLYKATSCLVFAFCTLNSSSYSYAAESSLNKPIVAKSEQQIAPKLSMDQYIKLQKYAYDYIVNNKYNIKPEKNESGFYRINIKTPDFIDSNLGIEKLRINYWPIDDSNKILAETIHDHPRYFESYILYGGYVHSIYNMHEKSSRKDSEKFKLYRINKLADGTKSFDDLGESYVIKSRDERVKEGKLVIMPTNVIHQVLYSVPGSLSMNIVYNDKTNKDYFYNFVSQNGSKNDIKLTRAKISGEKRDGLLNQIEKRLFNSLFQKGYISID